MSPPNGSATIEADLTSASCDSAQTLLIVDDDPVVRSLMRDALEEDGFTIIEAENGAEARAYCEEVVPALIVVDAVMPVMDGFELCAALRSRQQTAQIPI